MHISDILIPGSNLAQLHQPWTRWGVLEAATLPPSACPNPLPCTPSAPSPTKATCPLQGLPTNSFKFSVSLFKKNIDWPAGEINDPGRGNSFLSTTLKSMMNTKQSQLRFWHRYENGLINMIQPIPHNLYVSVKLTSLYCGLRLILVYPNPQ